MFMFFYVLQESYDFPAQLHAPVKAVADTQGVLYNKSNSSGNDTPFVSEAQHTENVVPASGSPDIVTGEDSTSEETHDNQECAKEVPDNASLNVPQQNSNLAVQAPNRVYKVSSSCSGGLYSKHVLLSGIMLFWGNSYAGLAITSASGFPASSPASK